MGDGQQGHGEITEALEQLRTQLAAAQEGSEGSRLRFRITEVEMEFLVEARTEAGASGGLKLGVVRLGGDGRATQGASHRLRVVLDVQDVRTGESATVSDRR
ncbi:trypco2 family protein [Streptomyces synnematoformans]|uniref:trypco2 family protein n=1 Tax=Streptomyces synnematoformans TaxID=415721 RepID=UPI0031D43099